MSSADENAETNASTASEIMEARYRLANQFLGFELLPILKSAVQLGIPEIIHNHGRPMPLSDLVSHLPINPTKSHWVYRIMRVLVAYGYFVQQEGKGEVKYSLTPFCRLLLKDNQFSFTSSHIWNRPDPDCKPIKALYALNDWFRNSDPTPFVTAFGKTFWEAIREEEEVSGEGDSKFDKRMKADSEMIASIVVEKYGSVFRGVESLVDVGGGIGGVAKGLSRAFPEMKCTVLDLPQAVEKVSEGTYGKNLNYVGGNMFEHIPAGDAVLLKWILHNWGDEDCLKILKNCRTAITNKDKAGGKLLVIETVIVENVDVEDKLEMKLFLDMRMLSFFNGGKERTEKEFAKLFADAGFKHYNISPITSFVSLIEVYPY